MSKGLRAARTIAGGVVALAVTMAAAWLLHDRYGVIPLTDSMVMQQDYWTGRARVCATSELADSSAPELNCSDWK